MGFIFKFKICESFLLSVLSKLGLDMFEAWWAGAGALTAFVGL